tara:strand:- start:249 stop:365 length:117 start_codon:yes stop_codon:yes gene_type:complete
VQPQQHTQVVVAEEIKVDQAHQVVLVVQVVEETVEKIK